MSAVEGSNGLTKLTLPAEPSLTEPPLCNAAVGATFWTVTFKLLWTVVLAESVKLSVTV